MAMTKCKECGNEISTKADACPKCGAKVPRTSGCAQVVLVLLGLIVLLPILSECGGNSSPSSSAGSSATPRPANTTSAYTPPAPQKPGSQWRYQQFSDPMSKGDVYCASVLSTNTVNFDFPYSGSQHGTLTLRTHPRHGKELYLKIEQGQFLCPSYDGCTVLVRFDDQAARRFSGIGPDDNSSEVVFINDYSGFAGAMLKAKTVRASTEVYEEGSPVFEFDVSGFDVEKYRPRD